MVLGLPATAARAEEVWTLDFAAAQKTAQEAGKDLFLEFTGSDWCPPCKALSAQVLSRAEFVAQMSREFVLVKLDYPRDTSKQSAPEIAQNESLKQRFGITGYPTVILAAADGSEYDREVGYKGEGARAYVATKLALRGKRLGRIIELDPELFPAQSDEESAFEELFEALEARRIQHVLVCSGTEEGITRIDAFLKRFPDAAHGDEVLYLRAVSFWSMGRYLEAAPAFAAFAEAHPESRLNNLARLREVQSLLRGDRPAEAIATIDAAGDTLSNVAATRATALSLLGRNDEALACLDAAMAHEKNSRMRGMLGVQRHELSFIGKPLPDFSVPRFDSDETITPASLSGKVILVDFWATWCRPCMRELPAVQAARAEFGARGFDVFGVSLDTRQEALEKVLAEQSMDWPQFFDGKKYDSPLAKLFGVRRIPYTLLVDAGGIVRYASLRGPSLHRLVGELVAEAASPGER